VSKRSRPARPAPRPAAEQQVWCRVDVSPVGTYMLTITYDDDHALSLTYSDLLEYVGALSAALMRALYTEAVRGQFRDRLKMPDKLALPTLQDLRDEWPDLATFGGYELRPTVSFEGRCSVQVWHADTMVVQFAPHNVREHIAHALAVYAAADLDASYRRFLVGVIGTDDMRARAAVAELTQHFPRED
jgi:hypothetical protein